MLRFNEYISKLGKQRCYLCGRRDEITRDFEDIDIAIVPASKKPIKVVLQHLANCIKTQLDFNNDACICPQCLTELSEYDDLMLKLLTFQKKLTKLLETTLQSTSTPEENTVVKSTDKYTIIELKNQDVEMNDTDIDTLGDSGADTDDDNIRGIRECAICNKLFKTKKELNQHMSDDHDHNPVYTCHICGAVRKDEEYLDLHMNVHAGKTENECRYCNKRYTRPVNTLRHMRSHWNKKKFQCEKCGVCFSQDNLLYNHKLRHEGEENPLICSVCNQTFKTKKTYTHHMQVHQENRKRFQCEYCPKSFTERYTLKMHMKTHPLAISTPETEEAVNAIVSENTSDDIPCVICGVKFENKDGLNEHLEHEHDVILK